MPLLQVRCGRFFFLTWADGFSPRVSFRKDIRPAVSSHDLTHDYIFDTPLAETVHGEFNYVCHDNVSFNDPTYKEVFGAGGVSSTVLSSGQTSNPLSDTFPGELNFHDCHSTVPWNDHIYGDILGVGGIPSTASSAIPATSSIARHDAGLYLAGDEAFADHHNRFVGADQEIIHRTHDFAQGAYGFNGYPPATTDAQGLLTIDELPDISGHVNMPLPNMNAYGSFFAQPQFISNGAINPTDPSVAATTAPVSLVDSPASIPAGRPPTTTQGVRHECSVCRMTFSRPSDLKRHASKHRPGPKRFSCPSTGCKRQGEDGFGRKDKLKSHVKNKHPRIDYRGL
jgi:hypothetical protein